MTENMGYAEIADKIADRLIHQGILDSNSPRVYLSFPIPEEQWEAELAMRSLDLALALNSLFYRSDRYRHSEDPAEVVFWERFSKVVTEELEDRDLFGIVISRME